MKEWENTLELLRRRGWDYGFVKCHDGTGDNIYSVHLGRGTEKLSIDKGTIEEAVSAINRMAEEVDGAALADQNFLTKKVWPQHLNYNFATF
jgi:hypothetical protein